MSGIALYSLSEAYRLALADAVDPETGEVTDDATMVARLDAIGDDLTVKAEQCARARAGRLAFAAAVDVEIKRLTAMKSAATNKAERIASYVEQCMRSAGLTEVKGDLFNAKLQTNGPSVVIDDEQAIPPRFVQVELKVRKAEIKKAIESGEEVPGAHLEQTTSIRIR